MAIRSVLQIDLRDGPFREFAKRFEAYDKALKKTPGAWALVTKNIDGSRASFDKLVAQMAAANVQEALRAKAQERADRLTRSSAERWQAMTRDSREFLRNVTGATFQLLKWGSLTGLISGLLGAGGLFGIDRLALSAAGSRRSALGLGASIGGQEAFKANFGRFVDPESFLQSVAAAKFDVTKRVGLMGAGVTEREIAGDTAQTAVALLQRLKQIADTTNPALFAQVLQARRLEQFATPTDLERLRNTGPAEFQRLIQQYGQRRGQFDLPDQLAERWQDFVTQLGNAGKSIETTLVKGLVPLAPGLTKLSESVEKVIAVFLRQGGPLEKWIGEVGQGLEKFAGYVGTDEFQQRVKAFVDGLGAMASAVERFVSGFGGGRHAGANLRDHVRGRRIFSDKPLLDLGPLGTIDPKFVRGGFMDRMTGGTMSEEQLLKIVGKLEGGTTGQANFAGAVGKYQIKPGTAQEFGVDPATLYTAAGNEAAARKILHEYARRYHGDTAAVLAAYNQGTGAGNRFRSRGDDPTSLKPEGQDYITNARRMSGYGSTVVVTIDNKTDSTVSTSANGIRQGGP